MNTNRILIVDDEPHILELLHTFLTSRGYTAECAATGHQALELMMTFKPSVMLLDMGLPGINGLDVLKRSRELTPSPTVIILSGQAHQDFKWEMFKAGAFEVICKPVNLWQLAEIIQIAQLSLCQRSAA
jgi:DNA-binding response OmpR family regulator